MRGLETFRDIVDHGLCIGCGACQVVLPKGTVTLGRVPHRGIRPTFSAGFESLQAERITVCPGYGVSTRGSRGCAAGHLIGGSLQIWRGYACEGEIRRAGASGGALTALSLHALNAGLVDAVLHTGADPENPWYNVSCVSRDRGELLRNAGSRYSASSPCEGLRLVEDSDQRWMFIGKPCDAAAARAVCGVRPGIARNLRYILSFFCAGTPHGEATRELVEEMGLDPKDVVHISYRGDGWPGDFRVLTSDGVQHRMSYEESWSRLQRARPLRCHLCPDGLGEIADISCGDAWDVPRGEGSPGISYILARTAEGTRLIESALASRMIDVRPALASDVVAAQGLVSRRVDLLGRLLAMRVLGLAVPTYRGFRLFRAWVSGSPWTRLRGFVGTLRRRGRYSQMI